MNHIYQNFQKPNLIYKNVEVHEIPDESTNKEHQEARSKLKKEVELKIKKSREEADSELQSIYDETAKYREKVLNPDSIKSSEELSELQADLLSHFMYTIHFLDMYVKGRGFSAKEVKRYHDKVNIILDEIQGMIDYLNNKYK